MIVGVVKESFPGERRVALVPATVPALSKAGLELLLEPGAGASAGFTDAAYLDKGARLASGRAEVFQAADVLIQVRAWGANLEAGRGDLVQLRRGQLLIGLFEPLSALDAVREVAQRGVTLCAMELIPRSARAQSMDVLSSMATLAGYKAALIAAEHLTRIFPMLITAAGTLTAARVLVVGAGVAGLQAISTCRRLGAVVSAYDVRPAVKQEVESVGAKFVELPLEVQDAQEQSGYARAAGEEFYRRQRELLARTVAEHDVVITTAAVPGKRAPVLITAEMVRAMRPGSVVVDLAAERGGNCELTRAGEVIGVHEVTIAGPVNVASTVPYQASQMYAKNVSTFLLHLIKDKQLALDREDEIVRETLVTHLGQVVHPRVLEALGSAAAAAGAGLSAPR